MRRRLLIATAMILLGGCAHVIPEDILKQVDPAVTFSKLQRDPDAYEGKMVLLGGVIVKTSNKPAGTLLEVYQTAIDRRGRPINIDKSEGRFLALHHELLESEIYSRGRKVTIAGIVQGEQVMKLGEIDYRYPYILIKDIFLWREETPTDLYPLGFWDPWWPYPRYPWDPRYEPYWRYRYYDR